MGSLLGKDAAPERRVVVAGTITAGKRSVLRLLGEGEPEQTMPHLGFLVYSVALQALRQNSQILQPVYSNPELVKESYDGLLAAMGNQADALEIMKQNPAVLTCGGAIAEETPDVRHCGLA